MIKINDKGKDMELESILTILFIFFILSVIGSALHMIIAIGLMMDLLAIYKTGKLVSELKLSTLKKYDDIVKNVDVSFFNFNTSFKNKNLILLKKKNIVRGNNFLKLRSILEVNQNGGLKLKTYYDIISSINLFVFLTLLFGLIMVVLIYFDISSFVIILFLVPLYSISFYLIFKTLKIKNKTAIDDYQNHCEELLNKC